MGLQQLLDQEALNYIPKTMKFIRDLNYYDANNYTQYALYKINNSLIALSEMTEKQVLSFDKKLLEKVKFKFENIE